jgi:hypothetical protein
VKILGITIYVISMNSAMHFTAFSWRGIFIGISAIAIMMIIEAMNDRP